MADDAKPVEFIDIVLVCAGVAMVPGIILILAFANIPDKNMPVLAGLIGFVSGTWLGAVINNRFGSSKGSATKDGVIADIAKKAAE